MQYVENDMDELFRKAGENYPLKTELSDWDTIALFLKPSSISNKKNPAKKKKYSWFGLLALLIAVTGISLIVFNNRYSSSSEKAMTAIQLMKRSKESINEKPWNSPLSETDLQLSNFNSKREIIATKRIFTAGNFSRLNYSITNNKNPASFRENEQDSKTIYPSSQIHPDIIKYLNNKAAQNTIDNEPLGVPESKPGNLSKQVEAKKEEATLTPLKSTDSVHNRVPSLTNKIGGTIEKSGFYFGIVAGPQLNQVKGQGFTKTGFSTGLLAGFSLNKQLSVETGVLYSKKHYYSNGKYFDMNKAGNSMPANMELISLTGCSNIFELPVKLKYDFGRRNRSNWFFTTGISSYLLTKENNEYIALVNGAQQNQNGNYMKKRGYFSGAVNVSFGYEVRTWQQTSIRIEPYMEIPIKGIGIGNLQVMTTGLHFGITHRPSH